MLFQMIYQVKQLFNSIEGDQEKGQGLIEYALIVVLISLAVLIVLGAVGGQLEAVFTQIQQALAPAAN